MNDGAHSGEVDALFPCLGFIQVSKNKHVL